MQFLSRLIALVICLQSTQSTSVIPEIGYLDLTQNPCDDFYQYTCGNFHKYHQLPPNATHIDHFNILEDHLLTTGNEILSSTVAHNDPVALKKAKGAYRACMDTNLRDSFVEMPELRIVHDWGGMPLISDDAKTDFSWNDFGRMSADYGVPLLFTFQPYQKPDSTDEYIVMILDDPLEWISSLIRPGHRKTYDEVLEESFKDATQDPFLTFIKDFAKRLAYSSGDYKDYEEIEEDFLKVVDFWQKLLQGGIVEDDTIIPEFRHPYPTLEDLQDWTYQLFGDIGLDWVEYFRSFLSIAGVKVDGKFTVFPTNKSQLYGVMNLVRQTDSKVLKNFAMLRVLVLLAPDSDQATRQSFGQYLASQNYSLYPQWEFCTRRIMEVSGLAGIDFALAYGYQNYYFNRNNLAKATTLIHAIQNTFEETIIKSEWMDDESRTAASTKAKNIITMLAYPDFVEHKHRLDRFYRNLRICTWDHYGNAQKLRAYKQAYSFSRLAKPRTRTFWDTSVFEVNAYYNRPDNRIMLPLAMLNPIYFYGDSLLDFSRLGSIIGHEITHGFDLNGQQYNEFGVMAPWWTNATTQAFQQRTQCFIEQYNNYYIPEIDAYVNGSTSINENLADNGGIRQAYRAFHRYAQLSGKVDSKFSLDQLFFIGYGTSWCSNSTVDYMRSYSSQYSPNRYRVNGPLANMEEFAKAFHCPVGSKMNPKQKCILW